MWGLRVLLFSSLFLFSFQNYASENSVSKSNVRSNVRSNIQNAAQTVRDGSFKFFHTKIQPGLQKGYAKYREYYGDQFGEDLVNVYEYLAPKAGHLYKDTTSYWHDRYPEFFEDFSRIPTPVKISYERTMFVLWDLINKSQQATKMDPKYRNATKMVGQACMARNGTLKVPHEDQMRLERLLNDLRDYSPDREMTSCFAIYGIPSDEIANAFNTGCNIFVFSKLYKMLNDNELRAVLSHEISHGVLGHGVKTLGQIVTTMAKTVGLYDLDGLTWILTNDETESFRDVTEKGLLDTFAEKTAAQAPRLELEADIGGTKLLNAAGYSASDLISALYKLHGVKPGEEDKNQGDIKSTRNYPSLYRRVQAIKQNMRF